MTQGLSRILEEIAEQEVPSVSDPWPRIRAQASPIQRRGLLRRMFVITCILLLLLILPLTAVAIQAAVNGSLHRFGLILINPTTATPPGRAADLTPRATPVLVSTPALLPSVTISDAQKQVPFPIRLPSFLPVGITMIDAIVIPGRSANGVPQGIHLVYGSAKNPPSTLTIEEVTDQGKVSERVAASKVEQVSVNGLPAVYIKGTWRDQAAANQGDDAQWDASVDRSILSWEENGITFKVINYNLGITRDEMIRLAESLR